MVARQPVKMAYAETSVKVAPTHGPPIRESLLDVELGDPNFLNLSEPRDRTRSGRARRLGPKSIAPLKADDARKEWR